MGAWFPISNGMDLEIERHELSKSCICTLSPNFSCPYHYSEADTKGNDLPTEDSTPPQSDLEAH